MRIYWAILAFINAFYAVFYTAQMHTLPPLWAFGRLSLLVGIPLLFLFFVFAALGGAVGRLYDKR